MVMTIEFPHKAPKGYSYEFQEDFKRNITAIWIIDHHQYTYNGGDSVRCIWGFYHTKKREYYSPINSKTVGSVVSISETTAYSGMKKPTLNPLEKALA